MDNFCWPFHFRNKQTISPFGLLSLLSLPSLLSRSHSWHILSSFFLFLDCYRTHIYERRHLKYPTYSLLFHSAPTCFSSFTRTRQTITFYNDRSTLSINPHILLLSLDFSSLFVSLPPPLLLSSTSTSLPWATKLTNTEQATYPRHWYTFSFSS